MKGLFVSANPDGTSPLSLDSEFRAIEEAIRSAEYREFLELKPVLAARPDDIIRALLRWKPHVVHFSGHGTRERGLYLQDEKGHSSPVGGESLVSLFRALKKDNLRVVVLNACNSNELAQAVVDVVDCAIGMNAPIEDRLAVKFAPAFYQALAFGRSVQEAFDLGKVAMGFKIDSDPQTERTGERDLIPEGKQPQIPATQVEVPQLYAGTGVDPAQIILASPQGAWNKDVAVAAQASKSSPLTASRRKRLESELEGLITTMPIHQEKLKQLRISFAIETGAAIKFQLEKQIQAEEDSLRELGNKIEKIEQELGA